VKLESLTEAIEILEVSGELSGDVADICHDSRRCADEALFVAVPGFQTDGHDFVDDALDRGARYIVHERALKYRPGCTYLRVADSRHALGVLGKVFFGDPSASLCLIGVTGTNGKTTVTFLLESILKMAGVKAGVIGTVNYRYADRIVPAPNTTPESLELQKMLREMADAGVTHVVIEVSSHAIDLKRVDECSFDLGIFTNLSQDHLDYHHSMEEYFLTKKKFFRKHLKGAAQVINGDDPWGQRILEETKGAALTFGLQPVFDVSAIRYNLSIHGIEAEVVTPAGKLQISSKMVGKFNLQNILASVAAGSALRLPKSAIQRGIAELPSVPGRLERIDPEGRPVVFVDYAHTEDALRKVLENLRQFRCGRIITVFGCGGDRDRTKRPLMGKAVAEMSDCTIVTSDNPRTEDPLAIIGEIEEGIRPAGIAGFPPDEWGESGTDRGYTVIPDRKSAIEKAVTMANRDDIILIAGKGHEDYQIIGTRRIFFDDRIIAKEILERKRGRA